MLVPKEKKKKKNERKRNQKRRKFCSKKSMQCIRNHRQILVVMLVYPKSGENVVTELETTTYQE